MRVLTTGAVALLLSTVMATAQDAPSGESVFRSQCGACHQVDARNRVGPGLEGVWERRAGSVESFRYSPAMKAKGEAGLVWDNANLRAYLRNPREVVPGGSMAYPGLRDDARLSALVDYLRERNSP